MIKKHWCSEHDRTIPGNTYRFAIWNYIEDRPSREFILHCRSVRIRGRDLIHKLLVLTPPRPTKIDQHGWNRLYIDKF